MRALTPTERDILECLARGSGGYHEGLHLVRALCHRGCARFAGEHCTEPGWLAFAITPLGRLASQAAVLIDPPYTEHYARDLYGTDYPRPAHLLAEASRVVRHNGRIGFVHYIVPNAPAGCRFIRAFGLSMGFGYPMRAVTIFERDQSSLFGGAT
jgi:hypothetical protein